MCLRCSQQGAEGGEDRVEISIGSEGDDHGSGGDLVVVLEMKMEQPLTAHKAGTITGLTAQLGQTITKGAVITENKD